MMVTLSFLLPEKPVRQVCFLLGLDICRGSIPCHLPSMEFALVN